ncbi:MAG: magnesium/cobalt efflux protein [Rhodanobacter sp. 68-29]|uniref:HlyC/CorC family transporter n=1 Tax=Rhodanobacter sp. PCA2 TaxID=2006117 RepID=UPI00086A3C0A|nr:transporter associated domain-containing protein [Rhodanobacter sp. PCA2]MBA2077904.1 magnesium/cobalt efflux protein [Rhodanobacter sp. PCA2]MBN8922626.1 CBS domain-containing protein [Rhodanobacter sp.]ODU76075.1 MAG: magnesium/cobalt efflux protein [Rhodanobacter sp. SCN 69-32]OJY62290.1 MAG: magnesium/cobalt efflux protein [Rhodanobacter sp. 68-29]
MNDDPGSTSGPAHRTWWDRLGHLFSGEPRNRAELIDELRTAQVNGLLGADTLPMLEGALKVTELSVDDVMIPRVQIVMIAADAPLADILAAVVESGHSRFPVHGEDKDEILGVLLAKDLLKFFGNGSDFDIHAILRPAVLIPESMRLNVLLAEFRRSRNHMALVVDEYGGVAGLITIEDVLEQIVGEIDDEHDDEEEPALIHAQADGSWLVSALTPIEDFNEDVGATFSDEEFDTIGGLITAEFGHLPEAGEEAVAGEFLFHVTEADDRRVQQFRVTRRANDA